MWFPFFLLLLGAALAAESNHAWKTGQEYHYLVRSRTLTGLDQLKDRYAGILVKAVLIIQPKGDSEETLRAIVTKPQYASIHTDLKDGWDTMIPDTMMELQDLPLSGLPFEIRTKHGVVIDMVVDKSVSTWEVNMLKSIVSQLQVDTQGENAKASRHMQVPEENQPYAMFKAMEDTVGGKCEVLYDITPLSEVDLQSHPEWVPKPEMDGKQYIQIMKTKNYTKCEQRMGYHYGITGETNWEPGANDNSRLLTKYSNSHIVISGNLMKYTIQSSVTTSKVFVSPRLYDEIGMVVSKMNLTLVHVNRVLTELNGPTDPEPTGNLVYVYSNPFSDGEERRKTKPSVSPHSKESSMSDSKSSVSSSEETRKNTGSYSDSSESSASSSSISSSEEHEYWQPKPTMTEAPQNPLLPYFEGYYGKSIRKSDKVNVVQVAKDLVRKIAMDLENPSRITDEHTMEMFTILVSVMRTMSLKQMTEVQDGLGASKNHLHKNSEGRKREMAWQVVRDAVAETGSGPALMVIKRWMENEMMDNAEAAGVFMRLPRTVRTPTVEYMETLFQMVRKDEVTESHVLNTTAILAFTDLLRMSQVNRRSLHNRYPVHSFGRMASKHNRMVQEKILPYLEEQLKKAVEDGNSPKIQTITVALGNVAHPRILGVFEPYIEGKRPVSKFQRLLMVLSLSKLAELQPKLARSVFYKIYLNTQEAHEIRCAAVFLLMKTKPELAMLQRMAGFTNYDYSRHVNSAVKSAIMSASKLKRPEWQDLARNARIAEPLLNDKEYGYQYSHFTVSDDAFDGDLAYSMINNYIGSDDSDIPRAWYVGIALSAGGLNFPQVGFSGMVSDALKIMDAVQQTKDDKNGAAYDPISLAEQIAKTLRIKSDVPEQFEGNVFLDKLFMPFDNHTLERLPSVLSKITEALKHGVDIKKTKMVSEEITLSFPTETGLPFVYTLKMPKVVIIGAESKMDFMLGQNMDVKSKVNLLLAEEVQGQMGIVVPFEHQHYTAGMHLSSSIHLPMKIDVKVRPAMKDVQVKVAPAGNDREPKILHHSVVPYTAKRDILDLQPVSKSKHMHPIHLTNVKTIDTSFPHGHTGSIRIKVEKDMAEPAFMDQILLDKSYRMVFPWANGKQSTYHKLDVYAKTNGDNSEPMVITVAWDSLYVDPKNIEPEEYKTPMAPNVTDNEVNSHPRRQDLMKRTAMGIKSARAHVLDLSLELPGRVDVKSILTVAHACSKTDEKSRTMLFWRSEADSKTGDYFDGPITAEWCMDIAATTPRMPLMDFAKALDSRPKMTMQMNMRAGKTCYDEQSVIIEMEGKLEKSVNSVEMVEELNIVEKCREDMRNGYKTLKSCQKAISRILVLDKMDATIIFDGTLAKDAVIVSNSIISTIRDKSRPRVNIFSPDSEEDRKVIIYGYLDDDLEKAEIGIMSAQASVFLHDVVLKDYGIDPETMLSASDNIEMNCFAEHREPLSCVIDKDMVSTFDDRTYPLKMGKCPHVMMTTYQREDPDNPREYLRTPKDQRVSMVSQDMPDNKKSLTVTFDNTKLQMQPGETKPLVMLDEEQVEYSMHQSYQKRRKNANDDEEIEFEIYEPMQGMVKVMSNKYGVSIVYDGERILTKLSDDYRNAVRGLCGNFDGRSDNDFLIPKNCMLKKPEEFSASYALTEENCEGPALENSKKAKEAVCLYKHHRVSNVISDHEAGRLDDPANWGHHAGFKIAQGHKSTTDRCATHRTKIVEEDDQICFTSRPVVICGGNCKPIQIKTKPFTLFCVRNGEAAQKMKKRIEMGANPDFSQKPVSMKRDFDVAIGCSPAA